MQLCYQIYQLYFRALTLKTHQMVKLSLSKDISLATVSTEIEFDALKAIKLFTQHALTNKAPRNWVR